MALPAVPEGDRAPRADAAVPLRPAADPAARSQRPDPFAKAMHELYGPFPEPEIDQWSKPVRAIVLVGGGVACWIPLVAWMMGWIG